MTVLSHKLGPGVLEIGAGPLVVQAQVNKCKLQWEESVDTVAAIPVLSGEEIPEEETASYKAKLVCTFVQDTLAAAGLIDYSWTNKGLDVAFKFIPNNSLNRKITGTIRMVPIDVGGDMKVRNLSDVTFSCRSTLPALGNTP